METVEFRAYLGLPVESSEGTCFPWYWAFSTTEDGGGGGGCSRDPSVVEAEEPPALTSLWLQCVR